jgi:hypothetical protein
MSAECVLCQGNPEITSEAVTKMTSQVAGIGKATMYRILKKQMLMPMCHQV